MNNEVNALFRSYNDLDLVKAENIVLESETKLNDKERKILMHVFSAFKKNKFQDRFLPPPEYFPAYSAI